MTHEYRQESQPEGEGDVEDEKKGVPRMQEVETLPREGGEGGEATAQTRGEEQGGLGLQMPCRGVGIEITDEQAAQHIGHQRRPGEERVGEAGMMAVRPPQHGDEIAQAGAHAAPEEDEKKGFHFV